MANASSGVLPVQKTGFSSPLIYEDLARPAQPHPLNAAPMSLLDAVGDVSEGIGYSNDFVTWEGPLVAGQVASWTATVIEAGAGTSTLKVGSGAGGVGGTLELATDNASGDNVNVQPSW